MSEESDSIADVVEEKIRKYAGIFNDLRLAAIEMEDAIVECLPGVLKVCVIFSHATRGHHIHILFVGESSEAEGVDILREEGLDERASTYINPELYNAAVPEEYRWP